MIAERTGVEVLRIDVKEPYAASYNLADYDELMAQAEAAKNAKAE